MSRQRYLDTKFWDDTYIVSLDPIEKLLFIYLLTNPLTNICGIYETSLRRIAFDTGVEQAMVLNILKRFEEDDKVKYQKGYIALKNFTKYQANNEKINKGIVSLLKGTPAELVKWVNIDFKRLGIKEDSLYKGLDRTSRDLNYVNVNVNDNVNVKSDILSSTDKKEKEKKVVQFNYQKEEWEHVTKEYITELKSIYPDLNMRKEFHLMKNWLLKHANKPKTNFPRFIINWIDKAVGDQKVTAANRDEELPESKPIDLRKELGI